MMVPFDEKDRINGLVFHRRSRFDLSPTGSWDGRMTGPLARSQTSRASGPENTENCDPGGTLSPDSWSN